MAVKENPGAFADATGAGKPVHATAEGTRTIAHNVRAKEAGTPYRITPSVGEAFRIIVKGRDCWALEELRKAGTKGCTPIDTPAPRWSAYVFNLRKLGVEIETVTKPHGGNFAGHHGRYVLRSGVAPDWKGGAA